MSLRRVIVQHPGYQPSVEEIGDSFRDIQFHIGGTFSMPGAPGLNEHGVDMFAHDEGLILRLQPNLLVESELFFEPMLIVGPVLFAGSNEEGETVSLTPEQEKLVHKFLDEHRMTPEKYFKLVRFANE